METSAQIFAESAALSMVVNPGHTPVSVTPRDTTRSPDMIHQDILTQEDIIARYSAAILAETGKSVVYLLDARNYWALKYKNAHFIQEHAEAVFKGNK